MEELNNSQNYLHYLTIGSKVEVLLTYRSYRSYFEGTIIYTPKKIHEDKFLVMYDTLFSDNNRHKRLREFVDLSRIRPLPPSLTSKNPYYFVLNEVVDVYHLDGWCVGVIDKVLVKCKEEKKVYDVRFENPIQYLQFDHDRVRPHLDWVDNKWVLLKTPKKEPSCGPEIEDVTTRSLQEIEKMADGGEKCIADSRKSPSEKLGVCTEKTSLNVVSPSNRKSENFIPERCSKKLKIKIVLAHGQEKEAGTANVERSTPDALALDMPKKTRLEFSLQVFEKLSDFREARTETAITKDVGAGVLDVSQKLPFVKNSSLWKSVESHEVFRKTPQKPHFSPLRYEKEAFREGLAIGNMVNFSNLMVMIDNLRHGDPQSTFDHVLEALPDFEKHGFDIEPIRERLEKLLSTKAKIAELEVEVRETEIKVVDKTHEKNQIEEEIVEMVKKLKDLQEQKIDKDSEILGLRSSLNTNNELLEAARQEFQNLLAAGSSDEDDE
ncbi:hypothetical protein ACFE04_011627 [Oxalis oulophora]